MTMHEVAVDRVSLEYEARGTGELLVLRGCFADPRGDLTPYAAMHEHELSQRPD
jgi:hypothetical protein